LSKKRIHELAKEYGMSGKELAGKLRDLGFTHIKSHMTALDEFEELQVEGVLGAHGYKRGESEDVTLENELGTGVIRRKKKKRAAEGQLDKGDLSPTTTQVAEPEPVAEAAEHIAEAPPMTEAPADEGDPASPAIEATTPETDPQAQVQAPASSPPVEELEVTESLESQPVEAAASTEDVADEPAAQTPRATDAGTEEPKSELTDLGIEGAEPAGQVETSDEAKPGAVLDPDKQLGPAGKVVGFIDLSKIQTTPKKSESRRLRSRDDVLPDVRPTLRHDSRGSMLRGDRGSRNTLTAAQLREREAGRYKRQMRGGAGGRGRGDRGGHRSARASFDGSPYSGQAIKIETPVTIKKLAEALAIKGTELLKIAFKELGFGAVQLPSIIDQDTAILLASELEVELEFIQEVEAEEILIDGLKAKREAIEDEHLERRNPTVAFLGHVDHGKTTLIDKIRDSAVAEGESGGITQHIGAYRVRTEAGHHVTIIDTPGHAAFTGMRARGAGAVDVVVLVIAADAGVQPQTEEALAHARAAKVPIVVAMNKVDRPEANSQRVLEQLSGIDVIPEAWGGETAVMPVSGITGEGIQDLLERIFLESEILELECHPEGAASGVVLEAEVQQGKGIVAHLLVQDGTLKRGDVILAGEGYGKVRSIHDDFGIEIQNAGPAVPVEVSGLSALPGIGEPFHVVDKLDEAKKVSVERARKNRAATMAEKRKLDNAALLQSVAGPTVEEVNVIVRADVQGTVEVLKSQIGEPVHDEVEAKVLQAGVGAVTENDVLLASASNAMIVAFNVGTGAKARQAAEREGVAVHNFSVLYDVIDTIRGLMEGRLAPQVSEEITGHTEIKRIFRSSKIGNIAGCQVLDGIIARDSKIRVLRDDKVVHTGSLSSLKREADDAREVREGFECGMVIRNYNDVHEGDIIESFKVIETARTLDSPPQTS
jgi:translation initiation factor IF-2